MRIIGERTDLRRILRSDDLHPSLSKIKYVGTKKEVGI